MGKPREHSSAVMSPHPSPSKPPRARLILQPCLLWSSPRTMTHRIPRGRQRRGSTHRGRGGRGGPSESPGLTAVSPVRSDHARRCPPGCAPAPRGARAPHAALLMFSRRVVADALRLRGLLHSPGICSGCCPQSR